MKKQKSHLTPLYLYESSPNRLNLAAILSYFVVSRNHASYSFSLLLTTISLLFLTELPIYAWDNSKNQIWQENSVQKKIDSLTIKACVQNRWKNSDHIYAHGDISMTYSLNKLWTAGVSWRVIEKKNKKKDWHRDYFSHLDIVNTLSVSSLGIKNRVQFTYTRRYKGKDTPDVRYRIDLYPSQPFFSIKLSPYLAGEVLYDFEASHIFWARQFTGLKASPLKWLGLDLYLMRQENKKPGKPQDEKYIYGLSARLKF